MALLLLLFFQTGRNLTSPPPVCHYLSNCTPIPRLRTRRRLIGLRSARLLMGCSLRACPSHRPGRCSARVGSLVSPIEDWPKGEPFHGKSFFPRTCVGWVEYWFVETLITIPLNDKYVSRSLACNRFNNKFESVYIYIYIREIRNKPCVCEPRRKSSRYR